MVQLFKKTKQFTDPSNQPISCFSYLQPTLICGNLSGNLSLHTPSEKTHNLFPSESFNYLNFLDQKNIICNSSSTIKIFDIQKETVSREFSGYQENIVMTKLIPQSTLMASISDEKLVFLWDIRTKKPYNIILAHSEQILDLDISADGRQICTTSQDSFTRVWSLYTSQCLKSLLNDSQIPSTQVKFMKNNNYLLVSSLNSKLHLWEWNSSSIVRSYTGHSNYNYMIDFQYFEYQQHNYIISGSEDGKIYIWDAQTQRCIFDYQIADKLVVQGIRVSEEDNKVKVFITCQGANLIEEFIYMKIKNEIN